LVQSDSTGISEFGPDWFAAHHRFKFVTSIRETEFHAPAKPGIVGQDWWEIVGIEREKEYGKIKYCGEWIAGLRVTNEEMEKPN
jgi:hypothetical protein